MSIQERLEKRQMTKTEYNDLLHQYRLDNNRAYRPFFNRLPEVGADNDTWKHPFWRHAACVEKAVSDRDRLPQYQYTAITDAYSYYLTMSETDYYGSQYEASLERAVSAYHMGYAIAIG